VIHQNNIVWAVIDDPNPIIQDDPNPIIQAEMSLLLIVCLNKPFLSRPDRKITQEILFGRVEV